MEQNGTKRVYTGKQKKVAEVLANPDYTGTITDLINSVGVPRTTFYRWLDDERYVSYINSLIDKYTDSELASVWKSLITKCKRGDVQAIKLYFELKGKYTAKIQTNISANINNPFAELSTEELKKLIVDE